MILPLLTLLALTAAAPPAAPAAAPAEEARKAPVEPAYLEFAQKVEKGINARDGAALDAHKELGERLDAIEATGLVELNELEGVAEYEGFVKSPEYKAWKKRRAAKK